MNAKKKPVFDLVQGIAPLVLIATGDHLFGKLLFTWLSLVMSMMVSFVLSFFPRDVLDEILNLIGSVSEGFPSYSCRYLRQAKQVKKSPVLYNMP